MSCTVYYWGAIGFVIGELYGYYWGAIGFVFGELKGLLLVSYTVHYW